MKIVHAQIYPLSIPLIEPIKMSGETVCFAKTVLLGLKNNFGRTGWGEASAAPLMTGETIESLSANIKYLASNIKDLNWDNPDEYGQQLGKLLYANSSAKSYVEMVLLDLYTQEKGMPLWRYLRTKRGFAEASIPKPLPLLRMLGGSIDKEITDAKRLHDEGYRNWKVKVGLLPVDDDLNRVETLCNLLKTDTISVDANGAMGLEDAIRFCTSPKVRQLSFAEQLIPSNLPLSNFLELKNRSQIPIGLDESIHGIDELERFIAAGVLDGASLKLIKTGGLLTALDCINLLEKHGLKINLACKVAETSVSAAATAALGFSINDLPWGFSMSNQYLKFDVCDSPLRAKNGHLEHGQLESVGLGVEPDIDVLRESLTGSLPSIEC